MNSEKNSTNVFFYDSYALIEMLSGSEKYKQYWESQFLTSKLQVFEVAYWIKKQKRESRTFIYDTMPHTTKITPDIILAAIKMKFHFKKRKLSMADVIGYMTAQKYGIPFLTGDQEFSDLPGVEFVK